jgi:hypothetical protein
MRLVELHRFLDNNNALRVQFEVEGRQVLKFVVQLESRFDDKTWVPVMRYDTAHGFAHCDKLHPYEATTKTTMETKDYNDALNVALDDLADNWPRYHRRYEEWLKQK